MSATRKAVMGQTRWSRNLLTGSIHLVLDLGQALTGCCCGAHLKTWASVCSAVKCDDGLE